MPESFKAGDCDDKDQTVYNRALNEVIRSKAREMIPEGEQTFYADYVLGVPAANLSTYLNGSRAFPAWLVVVLDKVFKKPVLLDTLTDIERSGAPVHRPLDPRTLERLFVLALKEEGAFNSMLAQGVFDHFDGPDEVDHLDRELTKLMHFMVAIRERIQAYRESVKATERRPA